MRLFRNWFALCALGLAVLGAGCSTPLLPDPVEPRVTREEASDESLLEGMRSCWVRMQNRRITPEEREVIMAEYNDKLLTLLRRCRLDYKENVTAAAGRFSGLFRWEHDGLREGVNISRIYDDMIPAVDVPTDELEEHYVVSGVGVPLVGVVPAAKAAEMEDKRVNILVRGTVSTLTAVMEFPAGKKALPVLRLIPRHHVETVQAGRLKLPLAGDFSAPIEVYWNLTHIKEGRFLGLLRPQELRDVTGLTSIEAYNPDKIPVILTHGLLSSAGTFDNLVNRLLSDPLIRKHYQFWYFNYPTGLSWVVTSANYREALQKVRRRVDPENSNPNWDKKVLVGHSMGGLITHYSQCHEPWNILRSAPYVQQKVLQGAARREEIASKLGIFKNQYVFDPVPAGQVIYLATPHKGAPMARYRIVASLVKLIQLPQNLIQEVFNIATLQEDTIVRNPKALTEWFTSVQQLSPDSYSIQGLKSLKVADVPTHSIIGDKGYDSYKTDGVVPYWSSHIPWGGESIVYSDHSVQDKPETAEHIKAILLKHLQNSGRM